MGGGDFWLKRVFVVLGEKKKTRPGVKRPSGPATKGSRLGKLGPELQTRELRVTNSHRVVVSLTLRQI